MTDPKKILLAVPTRGQPKIECVERLEQIRDENPGLPPIRWVRGGHTVASNRCEMVRDFLAGPWDYLLMVDDDVAAHPDVLGLAGHEKDIVGAPCLLARRDVLVPFPNVFDWHPERGYVPAKGAFASAARGLVPVDAIGTGVMCVARRVFEHAAMRPAFVHQFDADGVMELTEDLVFCKRAREAGFSIYADYDRTSDQWVTVSLLGLQERYGQAMEIYHRRMREIEKQSEAAKEKRSPGGLILPG